MYVQINVNVVFNVTPIFQDTNFYAFVPFREEGEN